MEKILFVNACVRKESRTLFFARQLLDKLQGEITELELQREDLAPLNRESLERRILLLCEQNLEEVSFRYAYQFAQADMIVIAAPYWDLSFPALLKVYLETITVSGITFQYAEGVPEGLCRAKKLFYVTTSGGPIVADFGYSYVETLAREFYGIQETICLKAENLDIEGADVSAILNKAKETIKESL